MTNELTRSRPGLGPVGAVRWQWNPRCLPGRCAHAVHDGGMEVLGSRILLRPTELVRSHRFYRDTLGLAIYREFGGEDAPGLVFFLGSGQLEVSGRATDPPGDAIALWIHVRDIRAEHRRLVDAGVTVLREPRREAWGLEEMWIADPDGVRILLVEIRRITHSAGTDATSPLPMSDPARGLTPLRSCAELAK